MMKLKFLILFLSIISFQLRVQSRKFENLDFLINVPNVNALTSQEVISIFKNGKSLWPSNQTVIIVLPSNKSAFAEQVAYDIYGGSISSMQKFWLALIFQGRANPPMFFQNEEDVFNYIANNPGAIGVVKKGHPNFPERYRLKITR